MKKEETEIINATLEMLLSIESKLNALINYSIHPDELDSFNEEIQRQRAFVIKRHIKAHPSIGVKLSDANKS